MRASRTLQGVASFYVCLEQLKCEGLFEEIRRVRFSDETSLSNSDPGEAERRASLKEMVNRAEGIDDFQRSRTEMPY